MKRRLLFLLVIALGAVPMFADMAVEDRDVLVTPDGTLYAVAATRVPALGRVLNLTVQKPNAEPETVVVPATAAGGYHSNPALAYDPESQTLFMFWQTMPAPMSSSLLFCSYQSGAFSPATEFAEGAFRVQWNLKIGVTRYVDDEQSSGSIVRTRASIIHAVWWEENGNGEFARYAMISLERGRATVVDIRDLLSFIENPRTDLPNLADDFNRDFLRQPSVVEQPSSDAVDVVFADWTTASIYRVEIRPRKNEGVLRPPTGRTRGGAGVPQKALSIVPVTVLPGRPGSDTLLFYAESDERVEYLLFNGKGWSEVQTITLGETVTREVTIRALHKLLTSE